MKIITLFIIIILSQVMQFSAQADDFFKFNLGLNDGGSFPDVTTKLLAVGHQNKLYHLLDYQLEGGVFNSNGESQGAIGFLDAGIGLKTHVKEGLYASYFIGPSLLTQTDTRLPSLFEFSNDFELGIRDSRGVSLGVNYKHFSNAGLTQNNQGRDFLGVKISVPLF